MHQVFLSLASSEELDDDDGSAVAGEGAKVDKASQDPTSPQLVFFLRDARDALAAMSRPVLTQISASAQAPGATRSLRRVALHHRTFGGLHVDLWNTRRGTREWMRGKREGSEGGECEMGEEKEEQQQQKERIE